MSTIIIKPYEHSHKEQVINLILDIQNLEFAIPITIKDQPDLESISAIYQQGAGNFWVALDGKRVVGTVALIDIGNQAVALRKMFVAAEYRGKSFGTAKLLLDTSLAWAKQQNLAKIYLGTTEKFLAAHRFYEKSGFKEITQQTLPATFPVMEVDSKFYMYLLL